MMLAKTLLVAVLGATAANAHMLMSQPVPYGKDSLNNSPLAADGGDFPCKLRGDTYSVSTENTMESGSRQQLHLQGQATHGGGSCQISLTEDRAPSKSSTWKVIQSIEGGCPANVDGNMGGDASAADPTYFNFTIPEDFAAGKYTLAWTWFNRIGNREMYMNCAPITITKSSSAKRSPEVPVVEKRTANYPPMFVANVNGCTTKEGIDIRFPQPGSAIEYNGQPANLAPEGEAACSGTPKFGGDGDTASGSSSSGSGSSGSGSGSSSSTAAGSAPTETSSQAGGVVSTSTSAPTETSVPSVPQPAASSTAPASPSSSSSGGSDTLSGACSPEGAWNCIAGTSFQRCANGQWTVSQQMAAGTQCTAGMSSDLSISAVKAAREISAMRFRKRVIGDSHHA